MNGKVIESSYWLHESGRRASRFGSCPWTRESDKADWKLVSNGFTIYWNDGTVGVPHGVGSGKPFESKDAATAFLETTTFKGFGALTY